MAEQVTIAWNQPMLRRFKKVYAAHKADRNAVFTFEGHQYLVSYAKYLIEFLEGQFKHERK